MGSIKQLLLDLKRWQKNLLLITIDVSLVLVSLWLAFFLRIGNLPPDRIVELIPLALIVAITAVSSFWFLGTYRNLLRAISIQILNTLSLGAGIAAVTIAVYGYFDTDTLIPRSIPVIFAIAAIALTGSSRILGRWVYRTMVGLHQKSQPIVIYGAGETGTHVAAVLDNSREFTMIGFIDDDKNLWGNRLRGRRIFPVTELEHLANRFTDLRVLICIAKITSSQKLAIIEKLQEYPVQVLTIPPLPEVIAGRSNLEDIKEVKLEELLGREQAPPIPSLFEEAITGKRVLVTGGGGSIGSEICRQILANRPAKLVVLDSSEFALYRLEQEMADLLLPDAPDGIIEYQLGSVTDEFTIEAVFKTHKPQLVYHAAAYKHVPIVEQNAVQGIKNNVEGTRIVTDAAIRHKSERFILVSTDKAVRPTNIMGATKRVAELVTQAADRRDSNTIFTMVRFGNVLGSSGSVIPLFKKQIAAGGPVTVTHPEITRFFMTIPEAAQLVIQAGSMAKGGEVFVLDMGEPVEIQKLARLMIQLSGKTVRDADNPNGDIELTYTGLRPGEKLFEELLISDNASGTQHPKIMMATENALTARAMDKELARIKRCIEQQDTSAANEILTDLVDGFNRTST